MAVEFFSNHFNSVWNDAGVPSITKQVGFWPSTGGTNEVNGDGIVAARQRISVAQFNATTAMVATDTIQLMTLRGVNRITGIRIVSAGAIAGVGTISLDIATVDGTALDTLSNSMVSAHSLLTEGDWRVDLFDDGDYTEQDRFSPLWVLANLGDPGPAYTADTAPGNLVILATCDASFVLTTGGVVTVGIEYLAGD